MKKIILIILSLASFAGYSQTVGQFRYDTTKFLKVGGRNHVMIENLIQTSDSTVKPLVVGADGVIKRNSYWPGGSGGGGTGSIEYILQGYGIKIDSTGRLYTVSVDTAEINNIIAGDTTIFETTLDSTGQPNNRILFSRNLKISSSPRILIDSANSRVIINNANVSAGGANNKLFVGGQATVTGNMIVQSVPTTNDTTYKEMVIGADGILRKRTYYPVINDPDKLNISDTAAMLSPYQRDITLTTTGSSGAATLTGTTLNIPQYSGGGGGTPAGANTEIQYNNSGAFGASSDFTFNNSTKVHNINGRQTINNDGINDALTVTHTDTSGAALLYLIQTNAAGIGGSPANSLMKMDNRSGNDHLYISNNGTNPLLLKSSGSLLLGTTTEQASSIFTLESTTKGFLPPRVTSAQRNAITSPVGGLMVFDTDFDRHLYYALGNWFFFSGDWLPITGGIYYGSSVGVGTSGSSTNPSAILEAASTTKGFLPPRMTTTQRDAIDYALGLHVYNTTTSQLNIRDAASWKQVAMWAYISINSTYTILETDYTIDNNATSGAYTVTLPTATGYPGRVFIIRKSDASANAVTVGTTSSQTINGSTTYSLASQYKYVHVQSDGSNWIVIANN